MSLESGVTVVNGFGFLALDFAMAVRTKIIYVFNCIEFWDGSE